MLKKRKRVGKKGAAKAAAAGAPEAAVEDVDVDSDAEDSDDPAPGAKAARSLEEAEDDFFETADEKRVRVAKEYLRSLESSGAGTAGASVQERLEKDVAEGQRRARVQVRNLSLGEPQFRRGHKESVTCLALSADERTLFSGGQDCAILRWDVETGKKDVFPGGRNMFDCGGHFEQVHGVSLIESRGLLASCGADRVVRFWDWRCPIGSKCTRYLFGHAGTATCIRADPDGNQVYSGSLDKSMKVWDLRGMRCQDTLFGHVEGLTSMDIYMKGRPVTASTDKTLRVWKVDKDTHLMFSKHTYSVDATAALDAERCVSGSQDGKLMLWTHSSKKPVAAATVDAGEWVTALAAVQGGNVVFSSGTSGQLRAWQAVAAGGETDGKKVSTTLTPVCPPVALPGCPNAIAVGQRLVVVGVGKCHRLGGWFFDKRNRNGVVMLPLSYDKA